jgi:hypothetical protein
LSNFNCFDVGFVEKLIVWNYLEIVEVGRDHKELLRGSQEETRVYESLLALPLLLDVTLEHVHGMEGVKTIVVEK